MRDLAFVLLCSMSFYLTGCVRPQFQSEALQDGDLKPYTHCAFSDGLEIVEKTPLASGVTVRTVDTVRGPKLVRMLSGVRVMFAYPRTDFFANVKAEQLPPREYPELKQVLIDNFEYVLSSSPSNERNRVTLPGLPLNERGLDRNKLEGGVLGFYLFFDDRKHVVTSI